MKILVVDDDTELCNSLQNVLREEGYQVETAHSGSDGMQLAKNFGFDLLILDWTMPDITGLEICHSVRKVGDLTPIIFLTGKVDYVSKEEGLDSGADDYLTKPFNIRELLARVRSVLRRSSGMASNDILTAGAVSLNQKQRILSVENRTISLTAMETSLMSFLIRSDKPVSSQEIFSHVWPSDSDSTSDTVRVHVRILRKKIELAGMPQVIERNSQGYYLA